MQRSSAADYFERLPRRELRRYVACLWVEQAGGDGSQYRACALADGYVDLVFGRSLWVRGPDTRAHRIGYGAGTRFLGVRFRPGAAAGVLGTPASELADTRVFLRDLWGSAAEELEERLADAESTEEAGALLEEELLRRLRVRDPAIEALIPVLSQGSPRIPTLAAWLGLSQRQLLRRSNASLGYGPKTFARILRFQRFRTLGSTRPGAGLARLAALAGYADQSHLTRECRLHGGGVPSAFVACA